jgi:hypothetical protein
MQMQALQLRFAASRRAGVPQHDQRRLESQQALDVERGWFADARNAGNFCRVVAGIVDADDSVARAGGEQQFRDVRTQADDSRHGVGRASANARSAERERQTQEASAPDGHTAFDYNVAAQKMGR